ARVQMTNIIRTLLDVEVVGDVEPPKPQYRFCADLELSKNYALPIVFNGQRPEFMVNLIDRIVASTAGLGVCVEVVAKADPNATLGIQKFVYNKLYPKTSTSSLGVNILDPVVDLIGAGIGQAPKTETVTSVRGGRAGQNKVDSWSRELVKHAELKLASNLFTCKILVFGNSLQTVQAIKKALPAAPTNRLKTFKTTKKPKQHPTTTLKAPTRYWIRNNVLCRLWWALPLSILLLAGIFGFFNPIKLFTSGFSNVDLIPLCLAVFFAVCLFVAFRKRQPIVLSTQELAQIIGLPTAIAKLPIALGKVPVSRTQLGFEQTTKEKEKEPKNEKQPFNKEEKTEKEAEGELCQKTTFPVSRHFPYSEEEKPFT
ncbi:hypothetical protein, partial [Candidatus Bathycorpusculum sp.]|uniref:hypothetical protein n=1 Tax=Candidatus Bathycorpusculum sp. TaxID=2994959 RepID=UPI00281B5E7B|nr:hypothetical protein [Candidatus Termitimicrobium sp.]